jgi:hypothetical protein
MIRVGRAASAPSLLGLQAGCPHEALNPLAPTADTLGAQFGMHAWAAVGVPALLMDRTDRMVESLVGMHAWAYWSPLGRVKARPGYA